MGILPNCKDPILTALKSKGYNIVQLPRVDLIPTQLLVANNRKLQRLGEITSVFVQNPGAPAFPQIRPDQPGPNIAVTKSADLDLGVGLSILGGLISALGGATLGLNLAYSKARRIQMEYSATLENSAELAMIDQFLAGASVNPYSRAAMEMLDKDKVYVVTSTLKASKLNVTATDAGKNSIGIDVPVLSGAIGGNLKVSSASADNSTVTFEGKVPLVFAFQAVQLIFDEGIYRTMKLVDAGGVVAEATAGAPLMADPDSLLFD